MAKHILNDPNRINPFQFANDICLGGKENYSKEVVDKFYEPWMVNRILSLYIDTVLVANELNTSRIPVEEKYAQYKYLSNNIRPKKRYAKWVKKSANEDVDIIRNYYNCGYAEAQEYAKLLNLEQINELAARLSKGGRKGDD